MTDLPYDRGLFIGRFQPFHQGHLYLLRMIAQDFGRIAIGIGSSQSSHEYRNPFTFSERFDMIVQTLEAEDLKGCEIVAIPDIQDDSLWVGHVQSLAPPFDVVYSHDPLTRRLFKEAGIAVESPPLLDKGTYSATEVRRRMVEDEDWEELVPDTVAAYIKRVDGVGRVKAIASAHGEES